MSFEAARAAENRGDDEQAAPQALTLWREAAEGGVALAAYNVGATLLECGDERRAEALDWLTRAADSSDEDVRERVRSIGVSGYDDHALVSGDERRRSRDG